VEMSGRVAAGPRRMPAMRASMRRRVRIAATGLPCVVPTAATATAADSALADAAERGDRAAVKAILERGDDASEAQADGMTALHWAAYRDDLEMARLLGGARADARAVNRYGVAPLSLACTYGHRPVGGMTALRWGACGDAVEMGRLLVGARADARAVNRYGVAPLSLACTNGNGPMVELLLEAGADPNTTLRGGETALMTAARTGRL